MLRTVLFSPANDQKKAGKAMASGADAVTLDLEDAVAYSQKEAARESLREILRRPPLLNFLSGLTAPVQSMFLTT